MIGHCEALGTLSALGPWLEDGDGGDDLDDDLDGVAAVVLVVVDGDPVDVLVDGVVVDGLVDVDDDAGVAMPGQVHSVCRRTL